MIFEKRRWVAMPPATFPEFSIDATLCKGCGRCVKSCPIQLLTIVDKVCQPNQRYDFFRCIGCQNCTAVCPRSAITIRGDYRVEQGFWKNSDIYNGTKEYPAFLKEPQEADQAELTETEKTIYKRRSVRLFRKKQVPRELVQRVIEAGRFAPSAGNNQPWKFIVIRDQETIDEIDRKCKQFCRYVMLGTMPHAWIEKQTPGPDKAALKLWQKALIRTMVRFRGAGEMDQRARGGINAIVADPNYHTFFHAPTLIILLGDARGIGSVELDMGICGQNMVLAAHALGLGTCYVSLIEGLMGFPAYRRQLGIEPPFKIITSIALGYPLGKVDNIVKREKARVHWIE